MENDGVYKPLKKFVNHLNYIYHSKIKIRDSLSKETHDIKTIFVFR